MNYFILDKELKTVAIAQTDSRSRNAFHVLEDFFVEYSNAPSTLELTLDFYHEKALEVKEGAHVVFEYENAYRLFQIKQVEEQHASESFVKVYAEESSFELLDAVVFAEDYVSVSAEYLLGIALADTDWQVGTVSPMTLEKYSFTAYATALSQVQAIATEVEGMLKFRIKFSPQKGVTGKYVDLIEKTPLDEGKRLEFGRNVNSVRRTVDSTTVCTAVIPVGANNLMVNGFDWVNKYDDKTITKTKGLYYLSVDEKTRSEINPNSDHHLFYVLQEDTNDKSTLCQKAYEHLKNHRNPKYTYEVAAIFFNNDSYTIGEQVRIIDDELGVSMTAEVEQKDISFCDPDNNAITLTNYVEKKSNISQALYNIQNKLQTSVLDNPLVVVSPDKPLIEEVNGNGTVWIDISQQNSNGVVILNKFDIENAEWITVQQTPSVDKVTSDIEDAKQVVLDEARSYADVLSSGMEMKILKGDTFPGTAIEGQLFIKTDTNEMYRWNGTEWVLVGANQEYFDNLKEELEQSVEDAVASAEQAKAEIEQAKKDLQDVETDLEETKNNLLGIQDELDSAKENLQAQADELTQKTNTLQTQAGNLTNEVNTLKTTTQGLEGSISTINTNIDYINGELSVKATKTEVQNAINDIEIGGRNLFVMKDRIIYNANETVISAYKMRLNNTGKTDLYRHGYKIPSTLLEADEYYVLSFKFQKISGTLHSIGGHCSHDKLKLFVDGVAPPNGTLFSDGIQLNNDTEIHEFELYIKATAMASSDPNIYIQINRFNTTQVDIEFDIWDIKLEKGTKATAWTPAPEDVESKISQNTSAISVNAERIESVYGELSEVQTAQGNRITQAESSITQNANLIASKVGMTEVTNAINNIQIGGRNLLVYKNFEPYTNYTSYNQDASTGVIEGVNFAWYVTLMRGNIEPNTTYTISNESIENNGTGEYNNSVRLHLSSTSANKDYFLRGYASGETYTFTVPEDVAEDAYLAIYVNGGTATTFKINKLKLEKGNKATDWTPAPEDVQGQIDSQGQRITTAESTIEQHANLISSKVSQTEVDNSIKGIKLGGRNLLLNSKSGIKGNEANGVDGDGFTIGSHTGKGTWNESYYPLSVSAIGNPLARKQITVSLDVNLSNTQGIYSHFITIGIFDDNSVNSGRRLAEISNVALSNFTLLNDTSWLENTWHRIYYTFSIPAWADQTTGAYYKLQIKQNEYADSSYFWQYKKIMVEEGTKPSAYVEAPEDTQSQIDTQGQRITTTESTIEQHAGLIASKVSMTEVTNAINNVQVGGRNILLGSGDVKSASWYNPSNGTLTNKQVVASSEVPSGTYASMDWTIPETNQQAGIYFTQDDLTTKPLEVGKEYVYSVYINPSVNVLLDSSTYEGGDSSHERIYQSHAGGDSIPANTWTRLVYVFKVKDGTKNFNTYISNVSGNVTIKFSSAQIEEGNKVTSWTPAPVEIEQRVTTAESTLTQHANQIASKVSQSTYDTDKASMTSRISSAESSITQNANAIASKVSMTEVTNAINDIQIGGRNLLINSTFNNGGNNWNVTSSEVTSKKINEDDLNGNNSYEWSISGRTTKGWIGLTQTTRDNGLLVDMTANQSETYTLSGWAYLFDDVTLDGYVTSELKGVKVGTTEHSVIGSEAIFYVDSNNAGKWVHFSKTFTFNPSEYEYVYCYLWVLRNGHVKVSQLKFERGSKATDWTPAPEDTQSQLDSQGTRITSAESSITQLANEIQSKVSQSTYDTDKAGMLERIEDAESTVTQTANSITSVVQQKVQEEVQTQAGGIKDEILGQVNSDYTEFQTRLASAESNIDQKADSVTLSITKTELLSNIQNIKVGGRNLLLNSGRTWETSKGSEYQTSYNHNPISIVTQCSNGKYDYLNGKEMTFSFDVYAIGEYETAGISSIDARFGMHTSLHWANEDYTAKSITYPHAQYTNAQGQNGRVSQTATIVAPSGYPHLTDIAISVQGNSRPLADGVIWYLANPKLEEGNKATDWTPAPEDAVNYTDSQINTTKVELKATTDGIAADVAKNTQDVTGLQQTTATMSTQIATNANAIAFCATKTELTEAIDDIEIGGRNHLIGTETAYSATSNTSGDNTWYESSVIDYYRTPATLLKTGEQWTFSCKYELDWTNCVSAKPSNPTGESQLVGIGIGRGANYASYNADIISIADFCKYGDGYDSGKFVCTFTVASGHDNTYFAFRPLRLNETVLDGTGLVIRLSEIKLERGSKATGWQPSPEDTGTQINSAIDVAKAEIKITTDDIIQSVSNTNIAIDDMKGLNKWKATRYDMTIERTAPSFELISGKTPNGTYIVEDDTSLKIEDGSTLQNYIGHFFTNVYVDADKSVTFKVGHDDGGSLYLNGVNVYSTSETVGSAKIDVTLNFKKGWNTIDVLIHEIRGNDMFMFNKKVSSQVTKMVYNNGISDSDTSLLKHAETKIIQNAGEITARATKSEAQGYATDAVNSLVVGGRNYIEYSKLDKQSDLDDGWITSSNFDIVTEDGYKCAHITAKLNTAYVARQNILKDLEPNTTYTLSGWIKCKNVVEGTTNPHLSIYTEGSYNDNGTATWFGYGGATVPSDATKWTRVYKTFTTDETKLNNADSYQVSMYVRDCTGDLYFRELKLEKGSKMTDWTPSPDDSDIRMTKAEASITVNAEAITQQATRITEVNNQVTTNTASIETNAEAINFRATKTELTDAVNNIQIDGRNLMLNSNYVVMNNSDNGNIDLCIFEGDYTKVTPTGGGNIYGWVDLAEKLEQGKTYTISFDIVTPDTIGFYWYPSENYSKSNYISAKADTWQRVTFTYTQTGATQTNLSGKCLFGLNGLVAGNVYKVRNIKLEQGNKATPWKPADEEVSYGSKNHCYDLGGSKYDLNRVYGDDRAYASVATVSGKQWIKYTGKSTLRLATINTLETNTVYTWSFKVFTDGNGTSITAAQWGTIYATNASGSSCYQTHTIGTTERTIKHTFRTQKGTTEVLHIGSLATGSNYYFADFQLTKGYGTSDYSPALDNVVSRLTTAESSLSVLPDQINSKVSQSSYNADQTAMQSTLNTMNTAITQKADQTTLTTLQTDFTNLAIGTRNLVKFGKGDSAEGIFMNFNNVDPVEGYAEHTLTSTGTYASVNLPMSDSFVYNCREYEVGAEYTWSYDIMFTQWDFPTDSTRREWWFGQRYTNVPSGETGTGIYEFVTAHTLPVVGSNGCELNKWHHVEQTVTIPTQASDNVGQIGLIQFYNSNADVTATVTFRLKNVKLEKGNRTTDWTPSNEELSTALTSLQTRISNAEIAIESDAITQTVMESELFAVALRDKADAEALGSYATQDDIKEAIENQDLNGAFDSRLEQYLENPESNLNMKYVSQATWQNTKNTLNAQFSQANGLNYIHNSLGFGGLYDGYWQVGMPNLVNIGTTSWADFTIGQYWAAIPDTTTRYHYSTLGLKAGDWITLGMDIHASSGTKNLCARITAYDASSGGNYISSLGNTISAGANGRSWAYFQITEDYPYLMFGVSNTSSATATEDSTEKYSSLKVARGKWNSSYDVYGLDESIYMKPVYDFDAEALGFKQSIEFSGRTTDNMRLAQDFSTIIGRTYTVSFYYKLVGSGRFIFEPTDSDCEKYTLNLEDGTTAADFRVTADTDGYKYFVCNFVATTSTSTIRFAVQADSQAFVTGIMVHEGTIPLKWSQAPGEQYNSNIMMDINGIKVIQNDDNGNSIGYTEITPKKFSGYYDTDGDGTYEEIFTLKEDAVVTKRTVATHEIVMGNLKFVNLNAGGYNGWALVPSTSNDWSLQEGTEQ